MKLHYAELFEKFLHTRYLGQKRFSLEGAETLIPLLDAHRREVGRQSASSEIVLGMAHRGRLNVLANILGKPYQEIFAEFEDNYLPDSIAGDGDVKYHLGFSTDRVTANGQHDPPVADAQPQPPGGGQPGRRGPRRAPSSAASATATASWACRS